MKGLAESLHLPAGVRIVVVPDCPPNTVYAVCEAGLPAEVNARLAAMPDGPEKAREWFLELAKHGHVVVAKNVKL